MLKNLGGRALLREPGLCQAYAGKVLVVSTRQVLGNNDEPALPQTPRKPPAAIAPPTAPSPCSIVRRVISCRTICLTLRDRGMIFV